jgi:hypothetical protein
MSPSPIPDDDQETQSAEEQGMAEMAEIHSLILRIVEDMGGLKASVDGIKEHLRVLNGTTAKTIERVGKLELHTPSSCEVRQLVSSVQQEVATIRVESAALEHERKAVGQTNEKWNKRIWPFCWLLFMFIIGLILGHADLFKEIPKGIVK